MLVVSEIREKREKVILGLKKKYIKDAEALVVKVIDLDNKRKETQSALDSLLFQSKSYSEIISTLIKNGKKKEIEEAKQETVQLKEKCKELTSELSILKKELIDTLCLIPNIPHSSVPEGNSHQDNEVIKEFGIKTEKKDYFLPHWELASRYDIIDFSVGNKITGAGFPVYKGKGAKLQRSLINFFMNEAEKAGYCEIQPPILINEMSGFGTGQLPDKQGQMYHIGTENYFLIPTAEVPITNMYRNVMVKENELPIKHVGYTPCFRREAGSWGSHVRGLNRLHQFDKVEIVQIEKPENSYDALQEMCDYVEELLKKLELPIKKLKLCGGDIGFTAALTFDFEVFAAGQGLWLEVSSVSNFESYQTNRLKLRYKNKSKKATLLHTLNGSALALPRIMAAIIENNQFENGIKIPEVLHPFTGFKHIN